MKNILITGSSGFVGKNLCPKLEKKYRLSLLSRNPNEKSIVGDLMDKNSLDGLPKKIDVIIHLAFSKNLSDNEMMIKNLIELSKQKKVKKIILLSSLSAKRLHPDDYGKTKLNIEKIIQESGLTYSILRPSIIYGKGSTSFNFMIELINKVPFVTPIIGNGEYEISPTHINDVIVAIERCINNKKTDKKIYDIPGGSTIYFIDLIKLLKLEIKVSKPNFKMPIFLCNIIATIFPNKLSKENIINITEKTMADITLAKKDFRYNPIKFEEGIKNGLI